MKKNDEWRLRGQVIHAVKVFLLFCVFDISLIVVVMMFSLGRKCLTKGFSGGLRVFTTEVARGF